MRHRADDLSRSSVKEKVQIPPLLIVRASAVFPNPVSHSREIPLKYESATVDVCSLQPINTRTSPTQRNHLPKTRKRRDTGRFLRSHLLVIADEALWLVLRCRVSITGALRAGRVVIAARLSIIVALEWWHWMSSMVGAVVVDLHVVGSPARRTESSGAGGRSDSGAAADDQLAAGALRESSGGAGIGHVHVHHVLVPGQWLRLLVVVLVEPKDRTARHRGLGRETDWLAL